MTPSNGTVFILLFPTDRPSPIRVSYFHSSIGRAQKSAYVVYDYLVWQHALAEIEVVNSYCVGALVTFVVTLGFGAP